MPDPKLLPQRDVKRLRRPLRHWLEVYHRALSSPARVPTPEHVLPRTALAQFPHVLSPAPSQVTSSPRRGPVPCTVSLCPEWHLSSPPRALNFSHSSFFCLQNSMSGISLADLPSGVLSTRPPARDRPAVPIREACPPPTRSEPRGHPASGPPSPSHRRAGARPPDVPSSAQGGARTTRALLGKAGARSQAGQASRGSHGPQHRPPSRWPTSPPRHADFPKSNHAHVWVLCTTVRFTVHRAELGPSLWA